MERHSNYLSVVSGPLAKFGNFLHIIYYQTTVSEFILRHFKFPTRQFNTIDRRSEEKSCSLLYAVAPNFRSWISLRIWRSLWHWSTLCPHTCVYPCVHICTCIILFMDHTLRKPSVAPFKYTTRLREKFSFLLSGQYIGRCVFQLTYVSGGERKSE